jgi:hypothetical protein
MFRSLNSIIGPWEKQDTGSLPTHPLIGIKLNVNKIKHIFIVLVLPTKSGFIHYTTYLDVPS